VAAHTAGDAMATRLTVCFLCEVELKKQRSIHSYVVVLTSWETEKHITILHKALDSNYLFQAYLYFVVAEIIATSIAASSHYVPSKAFCCLCTQGEHTIGMIHSHMLAFS